MLAGEWVAEFCRVRGLDWDQLTKAERLRVTMAVPCNVRCWRVGVSIDVEPGEKCPECGKERPPRSRYDLLLGDEEVVVE